MMDTIRSDIELDTLLLRDNLDGEISAQDIRDMRLTMRAGGAAGYVQNVTAQALGAGLNILDLPAAGKLNGFTFDAPTDALICQADGTYSIELSFSFTGSLGAYEFAVIRNGAAVDPTRRKATIANAAQQVCVHSTWTLDLVANDALKIGALGNGLSITVYTGGIIVRRR